MRISAQRGLLAGKFRHGGIFVEAGKWSEVDPNDAEIRATLLAYVPSHVQVGPGQERELAAAGLKLEHNRLIDTRESAGARPDDLAAKAAGLAAKAAANERKARAEK